MDPVVACFHDTDKTLLTVGATFFETSGWELQMVVGSGVNAWERLRALASFCRALPQLRASIVEFGIPSWLATMLLRPSSSQTVMDAPWVCVHMQWVVRVCLHRMRSS